MENFVTLASNRDWCEEVWGEGGGKINNGKFEFKWFLCAPLATGEY